MASTFDSLRADLPALRLGPFVALALAVHLFAAWCNVGFLNADEHYQIVEFAQYKLGRQSAAGLAWEFGATMRPALQPWIAAGAIQLGQAIGIASPFAIAFALRAASALLAVWMSLELCARVLRPVSSAALRAAALTMSLFFWITPTVHGRFSSENWGAALLVAGVCLMLDAADEWDAHRAKGALLALGAGLAWSAAFYCRFQIAASIAGAGLWLLAIRRAPNALLLTVAAAFLAGCGLNEILDRWLYGVWALVPYNYFVVNLVQGKAAAFGTSPWWMVPVYFAAVLIPPYSLAALALLVCGAWYARRDLLVWTVAPLVLLHMAIAHKEPRFLMPVLYFIGPLLAVSIQASPDPLKNALGRWRRTFPGRASVAAACAVNIALLAVTISIPANDTNRLDRWLWEQSQRGDVTLYAVDSPPFHGQDALTNSFYVSPRVRISRVETPAPLLAAVGGGPAYVYYTGVDPPALVAGVGACTPVLRTFPEWLGRLTSFSTVFDVHVGTVCRLEGRRGSGRSRIEPATRS